jgi:flagellar biosynthesis protein FlhG
MTGLGKSRILFYEKAFPEHFGPSQQPLSRRNYSDQHLSLFRQIDTWASKENLDMTSIRRRLARAGVSAQAIPRIIAVTSGKGGVGKTFISANLAGLLSQSGQQTLLFDADLGLANVHLLTSVQPRYTLLDFLQGRISATDLPVRGPGGIDIICGASGEGILADVQPGQIEQAMSELQSLMSRYDFLIIDNAAGISSSVMHFLKTADEIAVVTTPNTASILDAYGTMKTAVAASVSGEIGLLMNRVQNGAQAETLCDNISQCSERFLNLTPARLGYVVEDPDVEFSFQSRQLLAHSNPSAKSIRALRNVADCFIKRNARAKKELAVQGNRTAEFCNALLPGTEMCNALHPPPIEEESPYERTH